MSDLVLRASDHALRRIATHLAATTAGIARVQDLDLSRGPDRSVDVLVRVVALLEPAPRDTVVALAGTLVRALHPLAGAQVHVAVVILDVEAGSL